MSELWGWGWGERVTQCKLVCLSLAVSPLLNQDSAFSVLLNLSMSHSAFQFVSSLPSSRGLGIYVFQTGPCTVTSDNIKGILYFSICSIMVASSQLLLCVSVLLGGISLTQYVNLLFFFLKNHLYYKCERVCLANGAGKVGQCM